jgi:hypothetical protein
MKILFLIKKNNNYGITTEVSPSKSGLKNSAQFVVDGIGHFPNVDAYLEVCVDANEIDKFLHKYRPNICVIEAIWVTPTKLAELIDLHPHIKFVIRIHSREPFLAMEGNAIEWIREYANIATVSFNHKQTSADMLLLGIHNTYLPNIYPLVKYCGSPFRHKQHLYKIGCFGAIRPFKNQLSQAVAAILFADARKSVVHFYINGTRVEQRGDSVLKNLRALFSGTRHKLIETGWLTHDEFLNLAKKMDACMQVSFTETFNIVTADCISQHVPVVVSAAIDWLDMKKADPNNVFDIANTLDYVIKNREAVVEDSIEDLNEYSNAARTRWFRFLHRD